MAMLVMLPPQQETTRRWARRLRDDVPGLRVEVAETLADAAVLIPEATCAYGAIDRSLLVRAGQLRWLQAPSAHPRASFYFPELIAHPAEVTNFRGIMNDHVATHALALTLGLARRIPSYASHKERSEWVPERDDSGVLDLRDATVLVIGLGEIGAEVSRLLAAFGARVIGVAEHRTDLPEGVAEIRRPWEMDEILPGVNLLMNVVPHTPRTVNMFDARRIGLLPDGAYLVNVGRGATVDLDAVVAGLRSGHLAGVGLDVFSEEPLPVGHPLWHMPNTILTPHVGSVGPHLDERKYGILVENARRHVAGKPLLNVANKNDWN